MMAFGTFKVHAGDFVNGDGHQYIAGNLYLKVPGKFFREEIPVTQIAEIDVASEESVKRLEGTVGWGIVGGALLGPIGLLAGLIAGGKGKDVTFVCKFKDGRKFMGTAPSSVYTQIRAALF
jgi:hypothetical protein